MNMPYSVKAAFEEAGGGGIHYSQEGEDIALSRMLGLSSKYFSLMSEHIMLHDSRTPTCCI
jgi:hypothetical protein